MLRDVTQQLIVDGQPTATLGDLEICEYAGALVYPSKEGTLDLEIQCGWFLF